MTRKEEIKCASKDYINYLLDKQEYHNENYTEYDIQQAFEKGAQWADEHPKLPWISVKDDLPCNHEELIYGAEIDEGTETIDVFVANQDGAIWDDYMIYENNKWRWNDFEPAYWMIAPKLPKECKIKI